MAATERAEHDERGGGVEARQTRGSSAILGEMRHRMIAAHVGLVLIWSAFSASAAEPESSGDRQCDFAFQQPDPIHLRVDTSMIWPLEPSADMGLGVDGVVGLGLLQREGPWLLVPHASYSFQAHHKANADEEDDFAHLGGLGLAAAYAVDPHGYFAVGLEERVLLGSDRGRLAGGLRTSLQARFIAHGVVVVALGHQGLFRDGEAEPADVVLSFGFDVMQFLTVIDFDGRM